MLDIIIIIISSSSSSSSSSNITYLLTYLFTYLLTAIELSFGGNNPYTSTDKTNKHKYT
jgi:hypothetical protein